jgi:hypothetical protein
MLLWTDGEAAVVATGRGIARIGGGGDERVRFDDDIATRRDEPAAPSFLIVLDGGERALVGREGQIYTWRAGGGLEAVGGPAPRAAIALGDGRVLAALPVATADKRSRTVLAVMRIDGGGGLVHERTVTLPEMPRLRGELGVWAAGKAPWPEDGARDFDAGTLDLERAGKGWQGEVRLGHNRHGVVVTSSYSGAVVVLDPATLAVRWAFRVPCGAGTAVHAVALGEGALVVVCDGGKQSAVVRAGRDGSVQAQRAKLGRDVAWGVRAPLLIDDDSAVVTNALTTAQVHELTLAELGAKRVTTSPFGGEVGVHAHTSTADGATHVVAIGGGDVPPHRCTLHRLVRTAGKLRATPLAMPDLRPPERVIPTGPARHAGPASVGITAGSGVWTCAPGDEVELSLSVTSKGGPAPGLWIELSGPAIDAGLFEALAATAGEHQAPFQRRGASLRAELDGPALEPAYVRATGGPRIAKGEMPDPISTVAIRVRGLKAGDALLMVRIGPTSIDGTVGSAMQGRTIRVA